MSRSRKKTPVTTLAACKSQKAGKTMANKLFRRISRILLRSGAEELPLKSKELTDPWDLGGDGKVYWNKLEEKFYRK